MAHLGLVVLINTRGNANDNKRFLTFDNGEVGWTRRGTYQDHTPKPNFYDRKTHIDAKVGVFFYTLSGYQELIKPEWLPCTEIIEVVE